MSLTHPELVAAAEQWLINRGCWVVLTERGTSHERPDAIGWKAHVSTVVECKVSRADFLADKAKPSRCIPGAAVGQLRYYMIADRDVCTVDDLPIGWGLIVPTRTDAWRRVKKADPVVSNLSAEVHMLAARIAWPGEYVDVTNADKVLR